MGTGRCLALMLLLSSGYVPSGLRPAQAQSQGIHALAGQALILRGYDCKDQSNLKWKDAGNPSGLCDLAVTVQRVDLKKNKIVFTLINEGIPLVRPGRPGRWCPQLFDRIRFTLTDIPETIPDRDLMAGVESVLMSPESYLDFLGFDFSSAISGTGANPILPDAALPVMPQLSPLLFVTPRYPEEAKRNRVGGAVVATVVVGTDGRAYSAKFTESPAKEFERAALRVLAFSRYEPPRRNGKPVAVQTRVVWTFNVR